VFSVVPEFSTHAPAKPESARVPAQADRSSSPGFAALVDTNVSGSSTALRPVQPDRRDPAPCPDRSTEPAPRDAATNASTPVAAGPVDRGDSARGVSKSENAGKAAKPSKGNDASGKPDDQAATKLTDSDGASSDSPAATFPIATAVNPQTPSAVPSAAEMTGSATAPLAIATAAIVASAKAGAMPANEVTDATSITDAVAGAVNEVNTTNFSIAKTLATTPAPMEIATPEASTQLQTPPQLAAMVTGFKPDGKSAAAPSAHAASDAQAGPSVDMPAPAATSPAQHGQNNPANVAQPNPADAAKPAIAQPATDGQTGEKAAASSATAEKHHATNSISQPPSMLPDSSVSLPIGPSQPVATSPAPALHLTATAAPNLAVPLSGLAVQIAAVARSGNSRFEIRLDPAELGRIDVRLDVDRHGHVTSHLTVEKPETLALLRQDAPQLQRALEDAGLKTGQNGLQFSLRDQSSGQHGGDQTERQPHRLIVSDIATTPVTAASTTYSYAGGASRGIDISV